MGQRLTLPYTEVMMFDLVSGPHGFIVQLHKPVDSEIYI